MIKLKRVFGDIQRKTELDQKRATIIAEDRYVKQLRKQNRNASSRQEKLENPRGANLSLRTVGRWLQSVVCWEK